MVEKRRGEEKRKGEERGEEDEGGDGNNKRLRSSTEYKVEINLDCEAEKEWGGERGHGSSSPQLTSFNQLRDSRWLCSDMKQSSKPSRRRECCAAPVSSLRLSSPL